jgi:superfamily II RNA helicase
MEYKGFTLDPFQVEAYESLMKGNSVVVSAATGTGKTLIADFIIDWCISKGLKAVYTSPIKALSNQKYRDFSKMYGEENVGILTGDVQINPGASFIIMTTEVYRNMLMSNDPWVDSVKYVIFDEVHYVSDIERGTIWEESVIYSPPHVRFLCLSATIPNAREFADWIKYIKGHTVDVVVWEKRAVPLKHFVFDTELGISEPKAVRDKIREANRRRKRDRRRRGHSRQRGRKRFDRDKPMRPPDHRDLVSDLNAGDMLPAILFNFSRRSCYDKALELVAFKDFSTEAGRSMARQLISKNLSPELLELDTVKGVIRCVERGVGVHHAGLLPGLKTVVEELFGAGHLMVLYATETFSLGINMPARSVSFLGMRKYDGFQTRFLMSREYFQCAGRAGRRGIDKIGFVVTMVSRSKGEVEHYVQISSAEVEPIMSQFTLSYNTVINLVENHKPEEREELLRSSFDYYIRRKERKHMWVIRRYRQFIKVLEKLEYLRGDSVTEKGQFASKIYTHELAVSEMFATDLCQEIDDIQKAIFIGALLYEERHGDHFTFDRDKHDYEHITDVVSMNRIVYDDIKNLSVKRLCLLIKRWCQGCQFKELLEICNLAEGDVIRMFRNILDMASQIRHAGRDPEVQTSMKNIRYMIDRDVVKVSF